MALLQPNLDPTTGELDVNASISDIIDEVNRNADQLDSLNSSLKIITYGSATLSLDPTGNLASAVVPVSAGSSATFMAFVKASDQPTILFNFPYARTQVNHSTNLLDLIIYTWAQAQTDNITFYAWTGSAAVIPDLTFYYYIFSQPITVTT